VTKIAVARKQRILLMLAHLPFDAADEVERLLSKAIMTGCLVEEVFLT